MTRCLAVFTAAYLLLGLAEMPPLVIIVQALDVPAVFSAGDSLFDNGNNNDLNVTFSIARANHTPYGRDFDTHLPTGRFSNGKILPDFIAAKYNIPFALAFRDPNATGQALKWGINCASGGAGILDSTSAILTPHNLTEQLGWMSNYSQRLQALEGAAAASARLANGILFVSAGSNDFSYRGINPQVMFLTDTQFLDLLVSTLSQILQNFYNIGIRRFTVSAIGPLGCTPIALTTKCFNNNSATCRQDCNETTNALVYQFNGRVQSMLSGLQNSLAGSIFFFSFDGYNVTYDAIKNPGKYGFTTVDRGCCGTGYVELGDGCNSNSFGTCTDASKYIFWDAIHPGETFTSIQANRTYMQLQS